MEVSRARRWTKSTMAGSSMTGFVSGMETMVVTPPAAAASPALLSVSRWAAPGSPMKARMSMRPGAEHLPAAIDHLRIGGLHDLRPDRLDHAVAHQHAAPLLAVAGGVDEAGVFQQDRSISRHHRWSPFPLPSAGEGGLRSRSGEGPSSASIAWRTVSRTRLPLPSMRSLEKRSTRKPWLRRKASRLRHACAVRLDREERHPAPRSPSPPRRESRRCRAQSAPAA